MSSDRKSTLPSRADALPGRKEPVRVPATHFVNGSSLEGPFPDHLSQAVFGLGCFWGAERRFWETEGVFSTSVGYAGGITPNPTYHEVCTGMTGHTEVVLVVFDPSVVSFEDLLRVFWESHDPTQGMRQGNDRGTQYRSAIFTLGDEQQSIARRSLQAYQVELAGAGYGAITTEVEPLDAYYYAEDYHQQYLAKNPAGYCSIGGTGVCAYRQ
jgi:peptide-methionine (S)-S-oxide reductase